MLCSAVEKYIASAKGLPFFYAVGDDTYNDTLNELKQHGVIVDRVSDFCPKDDKLPDLDDIIDHFRTLDIDCRQNKHVLVGLGEYLALRGTTFTEKELRRLKNTTLGTARVVLLLRCITAQVQIISNEDSRLFEQQRVFISSNALSSISVTNIKYQASTTVATGIKGLLRDLEDGIAGRCQVKTSFEFPCSLIPVSHINTAFAALRHMLPGFTLPENLGTEVQWDRLLQDVIKNNNSLDIAFSKYSFSLEFEDDLHLYCTGFEYKNWLFFIFLKYNQDRLPYGYLQHVLSVTENYENLKSNILTEIINIPRTDKRFGSFYEQRKKLIRNFPESDMAIFIHENSVDPAESIYRFTDNTLMEREEIIKWISKHGYISAIDTIYPDLGIYLKDYIFDCGKLSEDLSAYFKQYRKQKVLNCIYPEFHNTVVANAQKPNYTHLETRDSAILRVKEKQSAFLYWIDALGVEYMPYIAELAKRKGLSMHVDIAYSELPTITSINRGFFEKWAGPLKLKEERLDEIKHKDKGGFNYAKCDAPIHLASELRIVESAIDRAATELAMHTCKSFVITSDHGASRLAVIRRQEEKYETDTKGEHSGRCCKSFPDAELPYAIEENGYLVLADYGRFKGSRAANVEVHGGASLEEVLVPVITLTLKKQSGLSIKLVDTDAIFCDRHNGTRIQLYISDIEHTDNVSVVINGNRYPAHMLDSSHFTVVLHDIKRAKKSVSGDVFDGDDLIGNIAFEVKGKTATIKSDFDDLF